MINQLQPENILVKNKLIPPLDWQSLFPVILDPIGKGSFGIVWHYKNLKDPQQTFAVKKLRVNEISDKDKIKNETKALEMIQNNDLLFVKYYGYVQYEKNT